MPEWLLTLTLAEPLTLGQRPVVSNEIQTLEYIPGTTLRGSLASTLALSGRGADLETWFGTSGPWWTPAYPHSGGGKQVVPMPASLVSDKGEAPFEGRYRVFNTLFGDPPLDAGEYRLRTEEEAEDHRFQWTGVRSKWLLIAGGVPIGVHRVAVDATMHVGLHYGRQANRDEALFSRREIAAGTVLQAWVRDPSGVVNNGPTEIFLGKRRSAGNGRAAVEWQTGAPFPWAGLPLDPEQEEVNVQLMTDCIVRDEKGACYRGLPEPLWRSWIGAPCALLASASASRLVMGWAGGTGLAREQSLAVTAGSVYRLANRGDKSAFQAGLAALAKQGIGERRHEGFGWLSVNPSWLNARTVCPRPAPRQRSESHPLEWPGLEDVPRASLESAVEAANSVPRGTKEFSGKVEELAAYAARVHSPAEVADYVEVLGQRQHDRGWKEVRENLAETIRRRGSVREVLFYLTAVAARLRREE